MIEEQVNEEPRAVAPEAVEEEQKIELGLRPERLCDFIGQDELKTNLGIFIEAAKQRDEPLEHILLYGNPGLGKTTLAHIIAREMGANVRITARHSKESVIWRLFCRI